MAAMIAPIQAPVKMPSFDAPKLEHNTASSSAAPLLPARVNSELVPPPRKNSTVDALAEPETKLTAPPSLSPRRDRVAERARPPVADAPVQVTIGRIEVTALVQAAPSKRAAPARKPTLSLDDYLTRRHGRER